jgi:CrcB protein
MVKNLLLVAAGGSIGAALRYWIYNLLKPQPFPYATLMINIAGSFVLGIIMALSLRENNNLPESFKLFLATGICGGFTTFSTFSYENIYLLQSGKHNLAFFYILASVVAGISAAWLGFKLINH